MTEKEFPIINNHRLNRFVIKADTYDGSVLYNTTTGSIVTIDGEEDLRNSIDELINLKFYVPHSFNEVLWVDNLRNSKNLDLKDPIIDGFTILTTLDCNARCFYCYEKGQHKISMTKQTAVDVANFIIKVSQNHPIDLRWFGGEPLVNASAIDSICNFLTWKGVEYQSRMISNGLLFSDDIIARAKLEWNLRSVQITLDGTKDVYQKTKSFKGANGQEFDIVLSNISKLVEAGIRVTIRLNQDLYNTDDLLELTELLSIMFKGNKRLSVYNSLLYSEDLEYDKELEAKRNDDFIRLQNRIIKCGLFRNNPLKKKIRFSHCMADNDSSIIITPKGDIGKCEHFTNQHLIGTIYDTNFDKHEIFKWKEVYQPTNKCFVCPLYPQCVRIKMCPEERELCSFTQCENKIDLVRHALLHKYKSFKKHNNSL